MVYKLKNGRNITIPDKEIKRNMEKLELSQIEAVELWLEDNEYEINEEQNALDEKAKKIKIEHGAIDDNKKKTTPRTVKISNEKKALFETILANIDRCEFVDRKDVQVLKDNKLIEVKIGDRTFKIDIIENRKPKKKE